MKILFNTIWFSLYMHGYYIINIITTLVITMIHVIHMVINMVELWYLEEQYITLHLRGGLWIWGVPVSPSWEFLIPEKSRSNKDTAVTERIWEIPTTTSRLRLYHPEQGKFLLDWTNPTWEHLSLTPTTTGTESLVSDQIKHAHPGNGEEEREEEGSPSRATCQLKQGGE